jgi:uncharacterized RDD family membrane protein YckC
MTRSLDPDISPQLFEGVALKRLLAWVIDVIIAFIIAAVLVPFTAFVAVFIWPLFFSVISFLYRALTLGFGGATWGMRIMSIELRRDTGEQIDGITAILHTLGLIFSFMIPIIQLISIVLMATGTKGKSLTDMALGTVMINRAQR